MKSKPTEIILATGNRHKFDEISAILADLPVKLRPAYEFPGVPEVVEDGATLKENAVKKARVIARHLKAWTLADDTGLEVDHLCGKPGVYSARWAGEGCSYADNNRKLLSSLKGVPAAKRTARFRCVIALSSPRGKTVTVSGSIEGMIASGLRGKKGFGYDPLFLVPGKGKTLAELTEAEKNRVSHRARALAAARTLITSLLPLSTGSSSFSLSR